MGAERRDLPLAVSRHRANQRFDGHGMPRAARACRSGACVPSVVRRLDSFSFFLGPPLQLGIVDMLRRLGVGTTVGVRALMGRQDVIKVRLRIVARHSGGYPCDAEANDVCRTAGPVELAGCTTCGVTGARFLVDRRTCEAVGKGERPDSRGAVPLATDRKDYVSRLFNKLEARDRA